MEKALKHPLIGIPRKPHALNNDDDDSIDNSHNAAATQPHASSESPGVWRCAKNSPSTSIQEQPTDQTEPHKIGSCLPNGLMVMAARCEGSKRGPLSGLRVHEETLLWVQSRETLEPGPGRESSKLWPSD